MQRRNFSDHILNYHKRQNEISEAAVHCGFVLELVAKRFSLSTPLELPSFLETLFFDNLWANKKCKLLEKIMQVGDIPRGNSKRYFKLQECFHCLHFFGHVSSQKIYVRFMVNTLNLRRKKGH